MLSLAKIRAKMMKSSNTSMVIVGALLVLIGILVVIIGRQYLIRLKLTDAILYASVWKVKVYTYFKENQSLPPSCADNINPQSNANNHVNSTFSAWFNPTTTIARLGWCNITNAIEIDLNAKNLGSNFANSKIYLTAIIVDDFLRWQCSAKGSLKCKYLPQNCQLDCIP